MKYATQPKEEFEYFAAAALDTVTEEENATVNKSLRALLKIFNACFILYVLNIASQLNDIGIL